MAVPKERQVDLRIMLPDHTPTTISIPEFSRTPDVFRALMEKLSMSNSTAKYLALFERMEHDFDRKLQSNEFPHQIFVKKYSSASSSQTCLYLRKWLFTRAHEAVAISDDPTLELFYHQAVEDVSKGKIPVGGQLGQLKTLSSQGKKQQYLDLVSSLPNYNDIVFPHCPCDARKTGHVILTLSLTHLRMKACSTEGVTEAQEHTFTWDMVSNYEADLEEQAFTFQYSREGKEARWVKVFSPFYRYMEECVDRINEELLWKQPEVALQAETARQGKTSSKKAVSSSSSRSKAVDITNDDL